MKFKITVEYEGKMVKELEENGVENSFKAAVKAFGGFGAPTVKAQNTELGILIFDPSGFSSIKVNILGMYLNGADETCMAMATKTLEE